MGFTSSFLCFMIELLHVLMCFRQENIFDEVDSCNDVDSLTWVPRRNNITDEPYSVLKCFKERIHHYITDKNVIIMFLLGAVCFLVWEDM